MLSREPSVDEHVEQGAAAWGLLRIRRRGFRIAPDLAGRRAYAHPPRASTCGAV